MLEGFPEKDRATFLEMVKAAVRNLGGGFPSELVAALCFR